MTEENKTKEDTNESLNEGITLEETNQLNSPLASESIEDFSGRPVRAFFVSIANTQEEAQAIAEGKIPTSNFMPLYAETQEHAVQFLKDRGVFIINFEALEVLEMKVFMLRSLAEKNGIPLKREKMFDGRLLMLEQKPPVIYAGPETVQPEVNTTQENTTESI